MAWTCLLANYAKILLIDFGIQWVAWIVAYLLKTEKFYDLTGTYV